MKKTAKIYIAGHRGMVGSAFVRRLVSDGYSNLVLPTSKELDLRNQNQVNDFFDKEKPEYVVLAAAKVGGIQANNEFKAEFIYDNLLIEANVIHASFQNSVRKLLFLGSSCIYPKLAQQPIKESYLLSGYLEPTNRPYAIAKIAGIELCDSYRFQYGCNFISAMPTNLYGPGDNYSLENAHVIPALIRKFKEAKSNAVESVIVWGDGTPKREFLHVDDLVDACLFLFHHYNDYGPVNVGYGYDISIKELAELIASIVDYNGNICYDKSKPNGTPRKILDSDFLMKHNWKPRIDLKSGLTEVIHEFIQNCHRENYCS